MTNATTIQEAREIIGNDADGLTDEQLARMVAALDVIAGMVLDSCIQQNRQKAKTHPQQKAA